MEQPDSSLEHLQKELLRTKEIIVGFIQWLKFCSLDTARDHEFTSNHLLSFLEQDILETLAGVLVQTKEGIHNPAIRESRFLLELSIKLAYVQMKNYQAPIDSKLSEFEKIIGSPSISPMREINLFMLQSSTTAKFLEEVGRLYGESSNYVHLTPHSIQRRRARLESGRIVGRESEQDLKELNDFLQKIYAAAIVFISHSVPQYVIGDWHVDHSGELSKWFYIRSAYIAEIDSSMDYKHERQHILERVRQERATGIAF